MSDTLNIVCPHCNTTNRIPAGRELAKADCGKCSRSMLDTHPIHLNALGFQKHLNHNQIPLLVDYYASWCGPCKMMAPVFEKTAARYPLKIRFAKVDTEAEQSLASSAGIRGVPTLILYKNGQKINEISGALSEAQLIQWINASL